MSKIELTMLICLCLIPIIALVIILPKKFKRLKKEKQLVQPVQKEEKVEEKPVETPEPINYEKNTEDLDSFRKYLAEKKQTSVPERKNPTYEPNKFPSYYSMQRNQPSSTQNKEKTIQEQIDDLSPEMKALIIAGVFDKKNY